MLKRSFTDPLVPSDGMSGHTSVCVFLRVFRVELLCKQPEYQIPILFHCLSTHNITCQLNWIFLEESLRTNVEGTKVLLNVFTVGYWYPNKVQPAASVSLLWSDILEFKTSRNLSLFEDSCFPIMTPRQTDLFYLQGPCEYSVLHCHFTQHFLLCLETLLPSICEK